MSMLPGLVSKSVLCWVADNEEVEPVADLARTLASRSGGRCQVLMSLDPSSGRWPAPLDLEAIAEAQRKLTKCYGSDLDPIVIPGHPVTEVRRYAQNRKVDLIVMGEQALHAEESCGEKLADVAPCTLLILVPPSRQEPQAKAPRAQD